jgi:hypothetical protein
MDWTSTNGALTEWSHWEDVVLLLAVAIVSFLVGWWFGRRRTPAGSSIFAMLLTQLRAHRAAGPRPGPARRDRFHETLLEEMRERVRERTYWKDRR